MWGTMWLVEKFIGKQLMANAIVIDECEKHIDITDGENPECEKCANYNEEMIGACNIKGTAAYIYEVDGRYVVGIHGAGWDFYDGVWDRLYDLLGLEWHDDCALMIDSLNDAQAHCKGCGWHYAFTGERTRTELEAEFTSSHKK